MSPNIARDFSQGRVAPVSRALITEVPSVSLGIDCSSADRQIDPSVILDELNVHLALYVYRRQLGVFGLATLFEMVCPVDFKIWPHG